MRLRLSEALRLLWGLLLLLALAASPLLALVLLALVPVVAFRPFQRKEYGCPSMTLRGEVVRSYSEKVIADWLFRREIRYAYEQPVFDPRGRRVGVPDFYLLTTASTWSTGTDQPLGRFRAFEVRTEHAVESGPIPPERDTLRIALSQRDP